LEAADEAALEALSALLAWSLASLALELACDA
jgi:hypothetical protein